jgi:uncharacterized protein YbjT (DUF2867 family)
VPAPRETVAAIQNLDFMVAIDVLPAEICGWADVVLPEATYLERDDDLAAHLDGADAVVFAAGAGPGSGPERKRTVDLGGALKLIDAATAAGVRRYVMVSSIGADPSREGDDTFSVYLRAKGQADVELQASGLDYTIVRPASLTDDPGSGRVRLADHVGGGSISRADVAAVLAAVLDEPATAGSTFELASGDVPVEQAMASLVGRR